jgi:hypothetical protein
MMDAAEREILGLLDNLVQGPVRRILDQIAERVERNLESDPEVVMSWEPVPLELFGSTMPAGIRSSWVFILRARTTSGAERHPNSCQRMVSYRGRGDLQTGMNPDWQSHRLRSDSVAPVDERWISIPQGAWHQAVVSGSNWVVVSFHTVLPHELIEERPDPTDSHLTRQRHYVDRS